MGGNKKNCIPSFYKWWSMIYLGKQFVPKLFSCNASKTRIVAKLDETMVSVENNSISMQRKAVLMQRESSA